MKNYEIVFNGQTYTLTEEELRDPAIQAKLPEDLEFRVITKPSTSKPDLGNVFTYSITEKSGPMKGREIGKVSATSTRDALAQAEAMGFEIGTFNVNRTTGSVEPTAKPTNVKEREALLTKRGVDKNDVADMARYMPYASADLYNKPADEISYGTMQRDVFSLPGRVITSALPWGREITGVDAKGEPVREDFGTAVGRTSEAEGTNFLGAIGRSPATGVAVPLSLLAAPAVASVPFIEGALATGAVEGGLVGAGTSAFNYATDEDYTIADATIETLLSAGIGSLIKGGSAKSIEKAKNMIRSAGNFTQNQIDYIYNKLGITRGSTEQKLSKAVPERIGDIANIEFIMTRPPNADELYAKMPAHMADVLESGTKRYITEDLSHTLPYTVTNKFNDFIDMNRLRGTMSIAEAKTKRALLDEFNESMAELRKLGSAPGETGIRLYLDRLLEEAKYFYAKDRDLGDILLKEIQTQYNANFDQLVDLKDIIQYTDLNRANLSKSFDDVAATTTYLKNTPKQVKVFESGGVGGFGTLAPDITPERAKMVGNTLDALRMPSIVATQDVLGNTAIPEYLNLNQMRSK